MFDSIIYDAQYKMQRSLAAAVVKTYAKGVVGPHNGVAETAKAIKLADPGRLRAINAELASSMNAGVRASVSGISSRAKHYRAGQGRLTGGLRKAVNNKNFTRSDEHGIYYANIGVLNSEAEHWGRLNFGTKGGAKITPPGVFRLRIDDRVIGAQLGFRDKPRAGFSLPGGVFAHGGDFLTPSSEFRGKSTGNEFYPGAVTKVKTVTRGGPGPRKTVRIAQRIPTVGIRSRNFLDAGLAALEREFPKKYTKHLKTEVEKGFKAGQRGVRVQPGTLGYI